MPLCVALMTCSTFCIELFCIPKPQCPLRSSSWSGPLPSAKARICSEGREAAGTTRRHGHTPDAACASAVPTRSPGRQPLSVFLCLLVFLLLSLSFLSLLVALPLISISPAQSVLFLHPSRTPCQVFLSSLHPLSLLSFFVSFLLSLTSLSLSPSSPFHRDAHRHIQSVRLDHPPHSFLTLPMSEQPLRNNSHHQWSHHRTPVTRTGPRPLPGTPSQGLGPWNGTRRAPERSAR